MVHPTPIGPVVVGNLDPDRTAYVSLERGTPIALLPVRLETRWLSTANVAELELRVRIFPDAIHLVTPAAIQPFERDEAIGYWRVRDQSGDSSTASASAWARLTSAVGEARAQWLRSLLAPTRGPDGTLAFSAVPVTEEVRLLEAQALPDRFVVLGYEQGYRRLSMWGARVPRTLQVGPGGPDDAARRWQVDFAAAEAMGMAVRVKVERSLAGRLTRLVVLGVRDSESATAGAAQLGTLIDGHARDRGASLLPAGTPTNHTTASRATAHASDVGAVPAPGTDGARLASALGLASEQLRHVGGANARSDQAARSMHRATWPATWGYFLEHIVGPVVTAEQRAAGRRLFVDHVRGHGPFPALSVGRQPYGVLPVVSLSRWKADAGVDDAFVRGLSALLPRWHASGKAAARLPPSGDPLPSLLDVLGLQSTSVRWMARAAATPEIAGAWWLTGPMASAALGNLLRELRQPIVEELARFGLWPQPDPVRIDPKVHADQASDLDLPMVTPRRSGSGPVYLEAIASMRDLEALRRHDVPGASPRTLLYLLLRHATLLVAARTANDLLAVGMAAREEIDVRTAPVATVWNRFARPVPRFGGQTARELVTAERLPAHPMFGELAQHRAAVAALASLSVSELERLTAETLDVSSHRLDAWVTAVATRRLMSRRATDGGGIYVGAFGWVDAPPVPASPGRDGVPVTDPGHGYVHAPSLDQARTAAVLRAGFVARPGGDLSVDLSSRRVRQARWLLAGLRAGRSLSELLGYRIERTLANAADIADVRREFPLAGGGGDASEPRLDGLATYLAWRAHPPTGRFAGVSTEILALVDGLSDVLLAESVHQHARGNTDRVGVLLEALSAGTVTPPEPDVIQTRVDAVNTTYQVIVSLGDGDGGWPGDAARARARANPAVNAWLAGVLGDPHTLAATVRYRAPDGSLGELGRTVTDLELCALDVCALVGTELATSPLVALFAAEVPVGASEVAVVPVPRLVEAHLLARSFRDALRHARPWGTTDDASPDAPEWSVDIEAGLAQLDQMLDDATERGRRRLAALLGAPVTDRPAARSLAAELAARIRGTASSRDRVRMLSGVVPAGRAPQAAPAAGDVLATRTQQVAWLADSGRVRPAIAALGTLGHGASGRPDIAAYRPSADRILVAIGAHAPSVRGLIIDSWTEARPLRDTTTGIAFHHDAPRARAPQAIWLAVPPDPTQGWSLATLEATVHETIDLMVARLARPHEVWGPLLPALYFAENLDDDTVSTTLADVAISVVATE